MLRAKRCAAIIVAGGSGARMGGPKQFLPLAGKTVVEWSLKAFLDTPEISDIVLVLGADDVLRHGPRLAAGRVRVVGGGATRMISVRNGFAALPEDAQVVAVHDGARPLVTPDVIRRTLEEAARHGCAVAAVPAKDTLKEADASTLWVQGTPHRSRFWQAQTPQSYRREILAEVLSRYSRERDATDDSQLAERAGHRVRVVPSTYANLKITTPEDLTMAEALLESREGLRRQIRTGFGYDIHRLVRGRRLYLAGARLEHPKGLLGHSDGDAALHAACDAVLGALGEGEIGMFFPPGDARTSGISSRRIVERVMQRAAARGAELVNLDVTLVAEEPKLRPHYAKLKRSLAEAFGLEPARVSLKAKSNEGLDAVGRGEAIACYAVAALSLRA